MQMWYISRFNTVHRRNRINSVSDKQKKKEVVSREQSQTNYLNRDFRTLLLLRNSKALRSVDTLDKTINKTYNIMRIEYNK